MIESEDRDCTTTFKQMIKKNLKPEDKPEDLICFYSKELEGFEHDKPVQRTFDQLQDQVMRLEYSGNCSMRFMAFSKNWIYLKDNYDGFPRISVIPRNPENVIEIPEDN